MTRAVLCTVTVAALVAAAPAGAGEAPEGMALIPAGAFLMGSSQEEVAKVKETFGKRDMYRNHPFDAETPKRKVRLKAFYIDRHEVTNRQYADFLKATGHPPPLNWNGERYKSGFDNYPVLYVSQVDAETYARWAGKRLPTEEEWEKAARGADGRVFPWGNEFDPYKTATADSDIMFIYGGLCLPGVANKVEIAEGDVSPYGVRDMAGNVREWTATVNPAEPTAAIVKGASWVDLHVHARAAYGEYVPRNAKSHIIGFRCVMDVKE